MDVKGDCQKIYDEALVKIKAEAETKKMAEADVMGAFGHFNQHKPAIDRLFFAISDVQELKTNYKARKMGIIAKYGTSANEELFLSKFAEAVKTKDFSLFYGFVEECFL